MATRKLQLTRRELIAYGAGAGFVGGLLGTTATMVARGVRPSLSIVGDKHWQLVLLDVDSLRMLLVIGAPPEQALGSVPTLMGVFRQRIDLLVATVDQIGTMMSRLDERWSIRRTVSIEENLVMSGPPERTSAQLTFSMSKGVTCSISPMPLGLWRGNANASEVDWIVRIGRGPNVVLLCTNLDVLLRSSIRSTGLIVTPTGEIESALKTVRTGCIAINASEIPTGLASGSTGNVNDTQLLRIYDGDIARIEFNSAGIAIPPWHQPVKF